MHRRILLPVCLIFGLYAECFSQDVVKSVVESELAFSKAAGEKGIKEAFLAYLADDSVLFRPHAVSGKKWMMDHPANPGLLQWEPYYAEVSGAGDLGFTTGPYTFSASPQEEPAGFGQFFSIWEKQPDELWKVVLDAGIEHEKQKSVMPLSSREGNASPVSKDQQTKEEQAIASADASFSMESLSQDVIVLRNGHAPMRGKESAKTFQVVNCRDQLESVHIANSADLGYTYGTYKCPSEAGVYVRVWRKEGPWRVALDYRKQDP